MKKIFLVLPLVFTLFLCSAFFNANTNFSSEIENIPAEMVDMADSPFPTQQNAWVDSVLNSLTLDQKIAQLFMVAAYSNRKEQHVNAITSLVEKYQIGGLIFFQGGPARQAKLTNLYQSKAKVPLLISIDGEWGLAMRLDSTIKYPRQMMLGAIQDNSLIYQMGTDIADQCKRLGIHVNLAPVVDVNNNPDNPVINNRAFGEEKVNVAKKGIAYMKGMQDARLLTTAKHFPGHGDTDSDSHKTLPIIRHNKERLENVELYPFRELIKNGLSGIMVAHLYIPSLDSTKNLASTLSHAIVTEKLKEEMGFQGLIFTDALNMKGVSNYYKPGEVDVKALLAGNDVLLFAEDVPTAIMKIKEAILDGEITQDEIELRCKKILAAKQWVGLDNYQPIDEANLHEDLHKESHQLTRRKLIESAITVLKNEDDLIPLKRLDTLNIASIAIGESRVNTFQKTLGRYTKVTHFTARKKINPEEQKALAAKLKDFDLVIVGVHNTNNRPSKNFGIAKETMQLVKQLRKQQKVIIDVFGNPYSLDKMYGIENMNSIIMSYQDDNDIQDYSAQLIFGGIPAKGKLPVTASPVFAAGTGLIAENTIRLKYTIPAEVEIHEADLTPIDNLVKEGINTRAFPGCQIMIARKGKVFYNKTFGNFTYDKQQAVKEESIYDIASITKIAASLASVMKLQDEHKLVLDDTLGKYLPELVDTTVYRSLVLREMLAHQAGLKPWIPFYKNTLNHGEPKFDIYSLAQSSKYPVRVAEDFYIKADYRSEMLQTILRTPLRSKEYKYSDLGYYFFKEIIEKQTETRLENYVQQNFYDRLGMSRTGYLPRERFSLEEIVPTERDKGFRNQLIHGDVHDPGAAMMGGVGGHAGVFSTANDLTKMMQMYLNGGTYGGELYLKESTIDEFAKCQYCEVNRRGAGFDKPAAHGSPGPTCDCISFDSFGHSGFTGTLAWADPDQEVVYVFLSNRIYPSANNRKLISMGTRSKIMRVIYEAIEKGQEKDTISSLQTELKGL